MLPQIQALHRIVSRTPLALALFKINWVALVVGQMAWLPLALIILPLQLLALLPSEPSATAHARRVLTHALAFACAGMALDQGLILAGVLVFPSALVPGWLAALWLSFALALPKLALLLARYRTHTLGLLGAAAGSLSYRAGAALGAVSFGVPDWQATLALVLIWASVLPLWRLTTARFVTPTMNDANAF